MRPRPTARAVPSADEVHIWQSGFDLPPRSLERCVRVLVDGERRRAAQFRYPAARSRSLVSRAALRIILGQYLACAPDELAFDHNEYGKPSLGGKHRRSAIRFNLSHSGNLLLIAVANGRDVGVDVEQRVARYSMMQIAAHFFSKEEVASLRTLPEDDRLVGFFATWTRKEAFIKARGQGLSLPLHRFTVSNTPGQPARLLRGDRPGELERWSMTALPIDDGYDAALVVEGTGFRLKHFEFRASLSE